MSDRIYRVLLVEDNPNHYQILQRFIDKSGLPIQVDHVLTAQECFNIFLKKNYDLLMLDHNLENYTGTEILRKLKEFNILVPIIMVTQQKDPQVAIDAMKLGAVDFIIKNKENFKSLPEKIKSYVEEFEYKLANDQVFKVQRRSILKSPDVRELMKLIMTGEGNALRPKAATVHSYEPDHTELLDMTQENLDRLMQLLTINKVLIKKPIGVKVSCPRCEADDVTTVPSCPSCGGKLFVKNTSTSVDEVKSFKCLDGCNKTFDEVKVTYKCNKCTKVFDQKESRYKHTFEFSINTRILGELRDEMDTHEELAQWELQSQQVSEQLVATKEIHKEIKSQLKDLIKSQMKNR
ncbi:MAG: response regulator [Candidatus Bathyarchaeota archaeon]|nr:response regulator [Candidatus Bathyarchaeota archaeon]